MSTKAPLIYLQPNGKSVKGEPTLVISNTSQYSWIYNDSGSGAHMDVTIFRPNPSDTTYFIVGDYAQGNYSDPTGTSLTVKAINDDPKNPLLKPATGFTQIWNDHGSGGHNDGSIWHPTAPDGYIALGDVCNAGYNTPNIPNYMCIRKDLVTESAATTLIWNDSGSGAHLDVSLYQLMSVSGCFVAQGNYNPYSRTCYKLIAK
jgi:hypothetical protein